MVDMSRWTVSFYSYVALKQIQDTLPLLRAHGVELEYAPIHEPGRYHRPLTLL